MRRCLTGLVMGLSIASSANAQSADECAAQLEKARQDMLAFYPADAKAAGVAGSATITCAITQQRAQRDCAVVAESPPDQGFGKAALKIESAAKEEADTPLTEKQAGHPIRVSFLFTLSPPAIIPNLFALRTIGQPSWRGRPSGDEIEIALSKAGVRRGVSGRTNLLCEVAESGRMSACAVTEENPSGAGFGRAAMLVASRFEMSPKTGKGCSVGGLTVNIPIRFERGG